jgi:hypothetical protein
MDCHNSIHFLLFTLSNAASKVPSSIVTYCKLIVPRQFAAPQRQRASFPFLEKL